MRALVTGGAGFIGSHIVDLLIQEGHDVAVVDNLASGKQHNVNLGARFHEVDVTDQRIAEIFRKERPEVVYHQAAQVSVKVSTEHPELDARLNVLGLLNILDACVSAGTRKIVFASSAATYGDAEYLPIDEEHPQRPASPYGITKMAGEHYLRYYARDRGLQFTALRYANVYGPRQDSYGEAGVVALFTRQLLSGETPTIHWDGEQVRDYVFVSDVARANLLAAHAGDGRAYCIGSGIATSVNTLFQLLCEAVRVTVEPRRASRRAGDLRAAYFDTRRAERELGWRALVSLREGLPKVVEFIRGELDPATD